VCGAEHFPRTDPVVIMLAVKGDKCLLGRQPRQHLESVNQSHLVTGISLQGQCIVHERLRLLELALTSAQLRPDKTGATEDPYVRRRVGNGGCFIETGLCLVMAAKQQLRLGQGDEE